MSHSPHSPCCIPSFERAVQSAPPSEVDRRPLSTTGMVHLSGGEFRMGSEGPEAWVTDGEGPVRETIISPFWIDETTVTNAQFAEFVEATGYVTDAERFGSSFIHYSQLPNAKRKELEARRVLGLEWWYNVEGANWRQPLGGGRDFVKLGRAEHPVVHVSWNDADAFARWAGKRLPTEAEWEFAARGGLEQAIYPWGDELLPKGKHRCNIWQGNFPKLDTGDDGYQGTAPARSFKPNGFKLYNMTGNVWEWIQDWFDPAYRKFAPKENPLGPASGTRRGMRGGSYLCHASYCNRYRCSARTSNTPDTSAGHLGFRCVASVTATASVNI